MPRIKDRYVGTERYETGIRGEQLPGVRVTGVPTMPTPSAAGEVSAAQSIGALGEGLQKLGMMAYQKQEEFDRLRAQDATTQLTNQLNEIVHHPETGLVHARKGINAINERSVSKDFGKQSLDIKNKLTKDMNLNKRQQSLFEEAAIRTAFPYFKQVQEHETKQYEEYESSVFTAGIETDRQSIMADPFNDENYAIRMQQIEELLARRFKHLSSEAYAEMLKKFRSGIEQERILVIAGEYPIAAYERARTSTDLLPDVKAQLSQKLKSEAQKEAADITGEELFAKYGMNEAAALEYIKGYEDRDFRKMTEQAYLSRAGRQRTIQSHQDSDRARAQNEFYSSKMREHWISGMPVGALAEQWLRLGLISDAHYRQIKIFDRNMSKLSKVEDDLKMRMGADWPSDIERQAELIMKDPRVNTWDTRDETKSRLLQAAIRGELNNDILSAYYSRRMITPNDRAEIKSIMDNMSKANWKAVAMHGKDIAADLKTVMSSTKMGSRDVVKLVEQAGRHYAAMVEQNRALLPQDPVEASKMAAGWKNQAMAQVIEDKYLSKAPGLLTRFWEEPIPTEAALTFEALKRRGLERITRPEDIAFERELRRPISLEQAESVPATLVGMFFGASGVSLPSGGEYGAAREIVDIHEPTGVVKQRVTRRHMGFDISAPAGTQFASPDWGEDGLTVIKSAQTDKTGYELVATGKNYNDEDIEIRFLHMGGSHFPTGSLILPGDIIGTVGERDATSTGAHLHIEMKVNGKQVDPAAYFNSGKVRSWESAGAADKAQTKALGDPLSNIFLDEINWGEEE